MSREIKFRAWNKLFKEMRYAGDGESFPSGSISLGRGFNKFGETEYIPMQFTGLLDKNGKEVYEGDIVNCIDTNPAIFEVKFIEGGFCCTSNNILPFDINSFYPSIGCRIEVIGNIYENPELIDGAK